MPNLLAGLASLLWGTADFLGGLAVKDWSAPRFGILTQLTGLGVVALVIAFFPADPTATDLWWGAAAGVSTSASLVLLYGALAIGPMNVAAPTAAVIGAAVPVVIGLAIGERPGAVALSGVAFALASVALVGSPQGGTTLRGTRKVLLLAAGAGAAIGLAVSCFAQTKIDSGVWPFGASKLVSAFVLGATVVLSGRSDGGTPRRSLRLPLAVGIGDSAATISMLLALQRGSLVLVGVLGGLFPVVTVVLAGVFLKERVGRAQLIGLALAVLAVALITTS
jgi:drug/metabolite transporter (DMT)-like permease